MSSPCPDDEATESPVLLLAELLRAAGVADELANSTLRTSFFGTSVVREAVASWDHVEASIQTLEHDLVKVAASIEAASASPALSAIHKAAKQTFSELCDELAKKKREKSDIARAFAGVWKTWVSSVVLHSRARHPFIRVQKEQYQRDALQQLCDERNARRAATKGPNLRSNKTRPLSDDPDAEASPRGGKPNAKSWPGRPLDPPCVRCARMSITCHAHENRARWGHKVACFECSTAHTACTPGQPAAASEGEESEPEGSASAARRFGPRSVQEAAARNAARADADATVPVRTAMEILAATLKLIPEEHKVEYILRFTQETLPKLAVGPAAPTQKRKRPASDD